MWQFTRTKFGNVTKDRNRAQSKPKVVLNLDSHALFARHVQFVVMGGSSGRMRSFAEVIAREINHPVQTAEQLDIHRTDRYALYKIGPVLSVSVSHFIHTAGECETSALVWEF